MSANIQRRAWYLAPVALAAALSIWTASRGPAVSPEAVGRPQPTQLAASGAAILSDLDRIRSRVVIHAAYYSGRDSWLYVGVHPVPRKWRVGR